MKAKVLGDKPLLKEFAEWLLKYGCYNKGELRKLLCNSWDAAYPTAILDRDVSDCVRYFLRCMADFAIEKAFGKGRYELYNIEVVVEPSCEDCSFVYVLELKTKTVLAEYEVKTWHFTPEYIQDDLKDLIEQIEASKKLLAIRLVVSDS